ncbi:hypothetical protein LS684_04165 [Cytobacillus spongiae]|uniref:B3/B4 domain-containing protein n=1 Tax=Cytobacillus spongiae TaxID=2901381 RepID=UPI001F4168FB|nr:phenylalanine--tRNA ligase beta subunit-related protein [Cytobacillus spongiae]UII56667.1 hypothetical protein LS684_04165 [Cytobacillus spongiae]
MDLTIHPTICSLIPDFKIGMITYSGIQVSDSPQMLKGRLQMFQESIFFDLESKNVTDFPGIDEWRGIFKKIGKDPNRYRHSAEALYRRVKKNNFVPSVHSATDLNNFFSLQYRVPIGIYDLDKLSGTIEMRIGATGEVYEGLNGRENSLEHLLITADESGPFGTPFVDSQRSAVTVETTNALQIVYLRPSLTSEESTKLIESLMNMFTQIHGGESQFQVKGC